MDIYWIHSIWTVALHFDTTVSVFRLVSPSLMKKFQTSRYRKEVMLPDALEIFPGSESLVHAIKSKPMLINSFLALITKMTYLYFPK